MALYRGKPPESGGAGGTYGVDIVGRLYESVLVIEFVSGKEPVTQVIPVSQIVHLEFGDGGISFDN